MNMLKLVGIRGGGQICAVSALILSCVWAARASVFDDAKFKLDLRGGDPNGNAFVDSGEIVNAYNSAQTAVLGGGKGPSEITAAQYATGGYDSYGKLPYVGDISVMNPVNGTTYIQKGLVLPQSSNSDGTEWSENGIVFEQGAVQPVDDGYVTFYARFKRDGHTGGSTDPNYLFGNGWNGTYGDADNGISIFIYGDNCIGIVGGGGMPRSSVKIEANTWYDLFVKVRNENGLAVAYITLYKANANAAPTVSTGTINHAKKMQYSATNTRIPIGCYLTGSTGWKTKTNPRAFKGQIANAMIWDRELTDAEMTEVMVGPLEFGGEWQIGAANGSADEFNDTTPADVYDVQTMPWNKMRKSLTAENPSLTLSTTMTPAVSDHQMSRRLTISPILVDVASAPVSVSLNGTVVGEIDLATTNSIVLSKKLWRHDGRANTIAITRTTSLSGTVQLDAIALVSAAELDSYSVLEDAVFKLDLRGGESTYTKPGDLGNALDYSAASPLVGYMGDQRGPQTYNANFLRMPAQETADVQNPYYPYTTNTQTVLHFYQDQKTTTASVRSSIVIPGAAPQGKVQTFYMRFRWDGETPASTTSPVYVFQSGNALNGWQDTGVAITLDNITGRGTSTTNACVGYRVAKSGTYFSGLTVKAGVWNDVFITYSQNEYNSACTVSASVCKTPDRANDGKDFNPPVLTSQSVVVNRVVAFDTTNLTIGGYHDSHNGATTSRSFRGLIADFMIWERALTDNEKIEIMAGQHGSKWTIGAANGSADEFTDDNPAAVFEPLSMEWKRMRKTLTAANPTLTLKSPLAEYEAGKPVILSVIPILVGTGAEVPVTVSVNGVAAGTLDLAKERNLIIERKYWTRDASGNVTVAITRTDTTGTVAIDAITLSGSWQIAPANGAADGMLGQQYASAMAFAGDSDVKHFAMSMSVGASHTNYTFGVWVPEGMGEKCGWKFRTATTRPVNDDIGLDEQHTLYVNGTAVGTHDGKFGDYEPFTLTISEGTLHDGMNYVQWVQTLPTRADQQALDGKPGVFQFYDYWSMTLVPPKKAFVVIIK